MANHNAGITKTVVALKYQRRLMQDNYIVLLKQLYSTEYTGRGARVSVWYIHQICSCIN